MQKNQTRRGSVTAETKRLAQIFQFTAQDLKANRQKRLSDAQRDQQAAQIDTKYRISIGFTVITMIIGAVILYHFFTGTLSSMLMFSGNFQLSNSTQLGFLAMSILLPAMGLYGIYTTRRERQALTGSALERTTGTFEKRIMSTRGIQTFFVKIKSHEFRVSKAQFDALQENRQYVVYHLPHSNHINAVEAVDPAFRTG